LKAALRGGAAIRTRDFSQALNVVQHEGAEALRDLYAERINTSPRKGSVTPKTTGQRKYVQAIRAHDVTFGVGPAGTGKTYLAMAMAVSALREEKVTRIILTPARRGSRRSAWDSCRRSLRENRPYLRPLHDALP
jgi:phosphate starvation-inducible PhoH-like protein